MRYGRLSLRQPLIHVGIHRARQLQAWIGLYEQRLVLSHAHTLGLRRDLLRLINLWIT